MASGGNITSTNLVVQAILNMTQTITQSAVSQQIISINCQKDTDTCSNCLAFASNNNLIDNKDYSTVCPSCFCNMENVNINNIIQIDFTAIQQSDNKSNFVTQINNSLTQQSVQQGVPLFNVDKGLQALADTSNSMYSAIQDTSFQNSLQSLKTFQIINVNNPNTNVINVYLDVAIKYMSNILQNNKSTSSILDDYDNQIKQFIKSTDDSLIASIVSWVVTLFLLIIFIIFLGFGINIIMANISLYASL